MSIESGHWYDRDGNPRHFVDKKNGDGQRPTTITDGRKNGWFPSVTTILKIMDKPALTAWKIDQAVNAVLTCPRLANEPLDDFKKRVLTIEADQEQEAAKARDMGTTLHGIMESMAKNEKLTPEQEQLLPYVVPAFNHISSLCPGSVAIEEVVVGDGYAGKVDYIGLDYNDAELIVDFKTVTNLPTKAPWPEAVMQLSAYSKARERHTDRNIKNAVLYISTKSIGEFKYFECPNWHDTYANAFLPLFRVWCWRNDYYPSLTSTLAA